MLNRWHLRCELDDFVTAQVEARERPKFSAAVPYIVTVLGLLAALLPRDFQDFLGISGETWTGVVATATCLYTIKIIQITTRAARATLKNKPVKTADEAVDEIMATFKKRQDEIAARQLTPATLQRIATVEQQVPRTEPSAPSGGAAASEDSSPSAHS